VSKYCTPLRYPGGKQRLFPFVLEVLQANDLVGGEYVEPYAGGAGIAIELLAHQHVQRVHLNDSSLPVFAFWWSLKNDTEEMCRRISSASLTVEEWKRHREIVRHPDKQPLIELGFSTFFLNRCNRSGVLSGGLIGGLAQVGDWLMDARFNRNDLLRRFEVIGLLADKITVSNLDAEEYITKELSEISQKTLMYCDPPYYEKSKGLYLDKYRAGDHERVAITIQEEATLPWIVSYDHSPKIVDLYSKRRYFVYDLQYSAASAHKGKEVFIFCDSLKIPAKSRLPYIDSHLRDFD
jgi:DNA adenine methylase